MLTCDTRSRVVQRRVERDGFRPKIWHYEWSGEDRLTACTTPKGDRWTYGYDPFRRRLFKQHHILAANSNGGSSLKPAGRTEFLWDGDVLAEEHVVTPEGKETRRTEWFYEPESFVPLAKRETGGAKEARLWYVITDHLGIPREMLSEDGSLVWAAEYTTWGSIRRLWQADNDDNPDGNFQGMGPDGNPVYSTRVYGSNGNVALKASDNPDAYACPIRFQGQWADEETGLYYNRFRYYDPDAAQYTSSDPIGLTGGLRSQGYVEQPSAWIDFLGLNKKGCGCKVGSSTSRKGQKKEEYLFNNSNEAKNWAKERLGAGAERIYSDTGKWIGWQNKAGDSAYWGHGDWGKGVGKSTFPHLNHNLNGTKGHLFLKDKIITRGQLDEFKKEMGLNDKDIDGCC